MKIKIKVMKETAFCTLQAHYEDVFNMIQSHPYDTAWLNNFLKMDEIYETKKYTIDDFELKYSDNYKDVEVDNGIILYEHLHKLPRFILCSKNFWAWIIFEKAYRQSQVAMDFTAKIIRNFWLENDNRRGIMLNVMGRQYFKVELSVDEALIDKYEMTKYLFSNHNIYKNFSYRNICMLKNVSGAILKASYALYKQFPIRQDDLTVSMFVKIVTRIGSIQLVDIIPEQTLYLELCKKMFPVIKDIADGK